VSLAHCTLCILQWYQCSVSVPIATAVALSLPQNGASCQCSLPTNCTRFIDGNPSPDFIVELKVDLFWILINLKSLSVVESIVLTHRPFVGKLQAKFSDRRYSSVKFQWFNKLPC
jgi:hypothetical protein